MTDTTRLVHRKVDTQVLQRLCPTCGLWFDLLNPRSKYCSGRCRTRMCRLRRTQQSVGSALKSPVTKSPVTWPPKPYPTRLARCLCYKVAPSHKELAFFRARPTQDYDSYYCGCRGWD